MQKKYSDQEWITKVQKWLEKAVIGLNLCPFAKKPWQDQTIRFSVLRSEESGQLLVKMGEELLLLANSAPEKLATTLLILPVLEDFEFFLDALENLNQLNEDLGLAGILQIASFHPNYQFAGTDYDDPANFTNRSPSAILHLIRESDITRVADSSKTDLATIPERNQKLLREMSQSEIKKIWDQFS